MITVEVKLRIAVLVPQELQHIINQQEDPMFIVSRENGHIIIKPMEEYGIREISVGTETDYRKGYMAGVTDGYEKMDTTGDSRTVPDTRNTIPAIRAKAGSHLTTTKTVPIVPVIAMTAIFMTIFSAYADLEPERKECYYAY